MTEGTDRVEDRTGILEEEDHMRDMEHTALELLRIERPYPSVARVIGRIAPADPAQWAVPNLAVRIEVESPEGARPISRIYTIRSFDAARSEVEIDFVLHEDDSPAMRWLHAARPGDRVMMTGPRPHFVPPFTAGKRAAVLADDTAIPAVFAILQAWPRDIPGTVWIDGGDPAAMADLPEVPGVTIHRLLRAGTEAAGTVGRLFPAAREAITDPGAWTLWAAGERGEMRDIRAHFRKLGMPRDALQVLGYWKHGTSSSELDRMRLAAYEAARAKGLRMEEMMDSDEAV